MWCHHRGRSVANPSSCRGDVLTCFVVAGEDFADEFNEARAELAAATDRAEHLERAVVSNRRIGMAVGILMERHRFTEERAFDHLRELSQRRNVKLRDVAEQLIYTGEAEDRRD
jgi:AmiR/NasT family two-component response regulator